MHAERVPCPGSDLGDEAADMAVGWLSLLASERVTEPAVRCALAGLCAAAIVCCVPRRAAHRTPALPSPCCRADGLHQPRFSSNSLGDLPTIQVLESGRSTFRAAQDGLASCKLRNRPDHRPFKPNPVQTSSSRPIPHQTDRR